MGKSKTDLCEQYRFRSAEVYLLSHLIIHLQRFVENFGPSMEILMRVSRWPN